MVATDRTLVFGTGFLMGIVFSCTNIFPFACGVCLACFMHQHCLPVFTQVCSVLMDTTSMCRQYIYSCLKIPYKKSLCTEKEDQ